MPEGQVTRRRLDVRDAPIWDALVAAVGGEFGALDVLVSNAGVLRPGPVESRSTAS